MILVSACLAGINCRYDGSNNEQTRIIQLVKEGKALTLCPEQLGGLSTPRHPAEITKDSRVITKEGADVTKQFIIGAEETLRICHLYKCELAILKSLSPSCGSNRIYDGTFTKAIIERDGITAGLLKENGIEVLTENEISKIIEYEISKIK